MSSLANERSSPNRDHKVGAPGERSGGPGWKIRGGRLDLEPSPLVMGVVNVTPDSFSDGGQFFDAPRAVDHALKLVDDGADLLDVGGESSRPGATPVPVEEELRRVIPVIQALAERVKVPISIDTYKAKTAREALGCGAAIINDIAGLAGDPEMISVAAEFEAGVVCMHMQGTPATMQDDPRYDDVVEQVARYLQERAGALENAGIRPECIALDPGIGFGKRQRHNLALLRGADRFVSLGYPICMGVSRKGFLNKVLDRTDLDDVVFGTLGTVCSLCRRGVQIVRVHDVRGVRDALRAFFAAEPGDAT